MTVSVSVRQADFNSHKPIPTTLPNITSVAPNDTKYSSTVRTVSIEF
jgi:hypothetical protein